MKVEKQQVLEKILHGELRPKLGIYASTVLEEHGNVTLGVSNFFTPEITAYVSVVADVSFEGFKNAVRRHFVENKEDYETYFVKIRKGNIEVANPVTDEYHELHFYQLRVSERKMLAIDDFIEFVVEDRLLKLKEEFKDFVCGEDFFKVMDCYGVPISEVTPAMKGFAKLEAVLNKHNIRAVIPITGDYEIALKISRDGALLRRKFSDILLCNNILDFSFENLPEEGNCVFFTENGGIQVNYEMQKDFQYTLDSIKKIGIKPQTGLHKNILL